MQVPPHPIRVRFGLSVLAKIAALLGPIALLPDTQMPTPCEGNPHWFAWSTKLANADGSILNEPEPDAVKR
jgi:hypothetical protein